MQVRSTTYPGLRLHLDDSTSVKFHEGVAEVSPEFAERLSAFEHHGIVIDADESDADHVDEAPDGEESAGEVEAAPVRRKPGRPKKSDSTE